MKHMIYFGLTSIIFLVLLLIHSIQWGLITKPDLDPNFLNSAVYGLTTSLLSLTFGWFILANQSD